VIFNFYLFYGMITLSGDHPQEDVEKILKYQDEVHSTWPHYECMYVWGLLILTIKKKQAVDYKLECLRSRYSHIVTDDRSH